MKHWLVMVKENDKANTSYCWDLTKSDEEIDEQYKSEEGSTRTLSWEETLFWISIFNRRESKDLDFLAKDMWDIMHTLELTDSVLDVEMVWTV